MTYIVSVDVVPNRKNLDMVVNQHGHSLIEFLHEAKFCVLNGRFDQGSDDYTCSTTRGVSVVDYFLVPHDVLNKCSNFCVTSMSDLLDLHSLKYLLGSHCKPPDHAMLTFELSVNVESSVLCDNTKTDVSNSPSLRYNFSKMKGDFMSSDICKEALTNVIDMILCNRERQGDIDSIYNHFKDIIIKEMKTNIPYRDISRPMRKRWHPRRKDFGMTS